MREDTLSKYKNYVTASRAKVFLSNLADYLLTFILTFLLFAVAGSPIFTSLPETEASFVAATEHVEAFYSIVDATHIQRKDPETGGLTNVNHDAKKYITALVKTTYFLLDKDYPYASNDGYEPKKVDVTETLIHTDNGDYPNDPMAYYFYTFKTMEESLDFYTYDGVDYRDHKADYLYQNAYRFNENDFETINADYPLFYQLKEANADLLMSYVAYGDTSTTVQNYYSAYVEYYNNAVDTFIEEIKTHYVRYIEENKSFEDVMQGYNLRLLLTYTFCFIAAWALLEFIPPLFLKEGRTIGVRSLKTSYATKEDLTPNYLRFVIKSCARLPLHYSGIFFILVIMNSVSIAFSPIGGFYFFGLFLASGILGLGSVILEIATKAHQGIPELLSGLVMKDTTQMEAGTALEEQQPEQEGK